MQQIQKKKYYRIELIVESPLGIGSGNSDITDKDIIRDSAGEPYIPATTIAGVVKDILSYGVEKGKYGKTEIDDYFGYVLKESELSKEQLEAIKKDNIPLAKDSVLTFYDARLTESKKYYPSIRDSVSLDEYKTAIKGAKFDMEIIEPGAKFVTFVHQDFYGMSDEEDYATKVVHVLMDGVLLGGKTSRGYGKVRTDKVEHAEFDMKSVDGLDKWLKFDIFKYDEWKECARERESFYDYSPECWKLIIGLEQVGGISIRRYTTDVRKEDQNQPDMEQLTGSSENDHKDNGFEDQNQPDMEQLTAHGYDESGKETEEPVIPGTTWAGAFKHRMAEFGAHTCNDPSGIFGFVEGKEKRKSCLKFSEPRLHGATSKILSRNAIDRFSGGTVPGALFTEKTWYGGKTDLEISWKYEEYKASEEKKEDTKMNESYNVESKEMPEEDQKALAATLTDLHMGFLSIGGETSIGRGLFRITHVNNKIIGAKERAETVYDLILSEIRSLATIEKEND